MGSSPVDIIKGGCWDILRCWELHLGDNSCHPAGVCVVFWDQLPFSDGGP